jgi:predicted DNA-binding transcriptional regulator YafY
MLSEKYELQQRLKAIELLAYWEGRLVTPKLVSWFGISRQQASKDIKYYLQEHNPDSLVHDPSVKAYIPAAGFRPVLTTGHINEYMGLIAGFHGDSIDATLESNENVVGVQMPDRAVRPEVVREVIKACRAGKSIKIIYASMNNPAWHERVISPHTLVYTGFRWHVRAYCHLRNEFRDFLLSRIERTPQNASAEAPNPLQDKAWNEKISITLIPNEGLSHQQQALVEKDFGMPDGRLQITVRKALAHYTLHRYQAAITAEDASNVKQFPLQLMVSDRQKLNPYLFNASQEGKV